MIETIKGINKYFNLNLPLMAPDSLLNNTFLQMVEDGIMIFR
jgi:hypothetical protein